ncbi:SDR family oxidoreductase [Aurantivibrio infirmus]
MNAIDFSLKDKTILITGASSGIGATLAKSLALAGARVAVAARREEKLAALVIEINELCDDPNRAFALSVDVSKRESVNAGITRTNENFGLITTVINNAGVAAPKKFLNTTESDRDFVMNTNFNGVWNVAQEAALQMVENKIKGSIVNIASVLGLAAKPGQTAYCSSKGAVIQLTRSMALDLMKHDIRVNAIAPGWFKTEMNSAYFDSTAGQEYVSAMPAKRLGNLSELAGPVIMLCSDAASFINGSVITVDGAISATAI